MDVEVFYGKDKKRARLIYNPTSGQEIMKKMSEKY